MADPYPDIAPSVVIVFLLGLITAYLFIAFQARKYVFSSDYTFLFFKFGMVISTIALGYFTTLFAPFIENCPWIGPTFHTGLTNAMESSHCRLFLKMLSGIWFCFAMALLPFGHTIINAETQDVDRERTQQLQMFYRTIYAVPYYLMMIVFSLNFFMFVVAIGMSNDKDSGDGDMGEQAGGGESDTVRPRTPKHNLGGGASSIGEALRTSFTTITPTIGWFFYHRNGGGDEGDGGGGDDYGE